jgi:hypothetical protein
MQPASQWVGASALLRHGWELSLDLSSLQIKKKLSPLAVNLVLPLARFGVIIAGLTKKPSIIAVVLES